MCNEKIILNHQLALMEQGVIEGTGQMVQIEDEEGNTKTVELPESIHTYQGWLAINRVVRKGEKCIASFPIWKYRPAEKKKDKDTGEEKEHPEKMFLTPAYWFVESQTQPAKERR